MFIPQDSILCVTQYLTCIHAMMHFSVTGSQVTMVAFRVILRFIFNLFQSTHFLVMSTYITYKWQS